MIKLARGDASFGPSEKVGVQNILGKVVSVERKGRWINLNKGRMKLVGLVYAWLWPLIRILRVPGRIFSLFDHSLFVKRPRDSFRSVAEKYDSKEEVDFHSRTISEGLEEWEELAVKSWKAKAKVLDVGCGAGREAIALAKIGFEVTGIDISPIMIAQAIKIAKKEGLNMNFKVQNVADIEYPAKSFDYVLFSRGVYSYLPTKKLRMRILKKIRDILKPDGMLFFTVYYRDKRLFSRLNIMGFFRRLRNVFFKEKYESEPGDLMVRYVSPASTPERLCFCHFFSSPDEVSQEVRAAGMTLVEVRNNSIWIVKP
jgi:SAM-dependent methyltransferase